MISIIHGPFDLLQNGLVQSQKLFSVSQKSLACWLARRPITVLLMKWINIYF